ncbi:MAG: response regulator transcription factor [Chloroflexota bacterium]|jgi:two-component system KDP operon response regulator KdpE
MMMPKILAIDDEPKLLKLVRSVLQTEGYDVDTASNGQEGLDKVKASQPDLVLLDILLPGELDGYEICRRIRENSNIAVIMLTAKAQERDKIRGFEVGADDYLTKPFSSRELLARVKAVLRRCWSGGQPKNGQLVTCGDLTIDLAQRRVAVRGKEIILTATEYRLLSELALNAGKVMLHEELLSRVWGADYRDETDYLRAYIRYLRRKVEKDPANPRHILSRPGIGYLLSTE